MRRPPILLPALLCAAVLVGGCGGASQSRPPAPDVAPTEDVLEQDAVFTGVPTAGGEHLSDRDSDGDGISDADEADLGTDPHRGDTDGDGVGDGFEGTLGTDPTKNDTDGDGLVDGVEIEVASDPLVADEACVQSIFRTELVRRPLDVIWIVDNSASMIDEIDAIERNINVNFAQILNAAELDYRVIVLSLHGDTDDNQGLCITRPLSATDCEPVPDRPANAGRFFHYSVEVHSHDAYRTALRTYSRTDEHGLAPGGWSEWLRADAHKAFIIVTDDESNMHPLDFELELLRLIPPAFGTLDEPDYVVHSIVGLAERDPPTSAWGFHEPIQSGMCTPRPGERGAVAPGLEYQRASIRTRGLRFPICRHDNFDVVFERLAASVTERVRLGCGMPLPASVDGTKRADPQRTIIQYRPELGDDVRLITFLPPSAECIGDHFQVFEHQAVLCDNLCAEIANDESAEVGVYARCAPACDPSGNEACNDRVDNDCDGLTDEADIDCTR